MIRWSRVRASATLSGAAFDRWHASRIGVIGAGLVGGPLALEIARAGADVLVCDPDVGESANLGTQDVRVGEPKALTVAARCNALRAGSARALVTDVRHVGVGVLAALDLWIDTTDDRGLAPFLTEVSNGVAVPQLRVAVDGSGERELGRCLASHGGAQHACQLCGWSLDDLLPGGRTPCPGGRVDGPPPTLAGGAIASAMVGIALVQAQRLLGGRHAELVLDREVLLDLDGFALEAMRLARSPACLSGHERWELAPLERRAEETSLADLFEQARGELGAEDPCLELYQHPLLIETLCACGARAPRLGTAHASPGTCTACGRVPAWRRELAFGRLRADTARRIGALEASLLELGLPAEGALVVARAGDEVRRYVLAAHDTTQDLPEVTP